MFGLADKWRRSRPNRLKRLAETIDQLGERDSRTAEYNLRVERQRSKAAVELHTIFQKFVARVNALVKGAGLILDPAEFDESQFLDSDQNFFQINVRGRILMVSFGPTLLAVSTEDFRDPYILEGSVRCFNQDLLEHNSIEEHAVYYCVDCSGSGWRYFKSRTYQTGPVNEDYLLEIFDLLL